MMVIRCPLPAVLSFPILLAVRAFPFPILIMLDPAALVALEPLVIPLIRHHPVVMLCKSSSSVLAVLAVVVPARPMFVGLPTFSGKCHARGGRRQQSS